MIKLFLIEQLFCFMINKKRKVVRNENYRIIRYKFDRFNPQISNKEEAIDLWLIY